VTPAMHRLDRSLLYVENNCVTYFFTSLMLCKDIYSKTSVADNSLISLYLVNIEVYSTRCNTRFYYTFSNSFCVLIPANKSFRSAFLAFGSFISEIRKAVMPPHISPNNLNTVLLMPLFLHDIPTSTPFKDF